MNDTLILPKAHARFVVTLPPEPSRVGTELEKLMSSAFVTLTDTKDAFIHLSQKAKKRLVVMTPYIDKSGASWAVDLFTSTLAAEKILIVRSIAQIDGCGPIGNKLRNVATTILEYEFNTPSDDLRTKETFHAKIVLADGIASYVGSANFLHHSRETNLECGFILEGDSVAPVAILIEAVIRAISSSTNVR